MIRNHGQALESFVERWFKPSAYSIILLRDSGYPCVFYGDFYGIPYSNIEPIEELEILLKLRQQKSYGEQHDYLDHPNFIGWTKEGDEEHLQSGLAVVISNSQDGEKRMYIGKKFTGNEFIDALGKCQEKIQIDEEGYGIFKVKEKSVSVWVKA